MIYSCFCRRRETIAGKYVVNISFSCWVNEKFTGPLGEAFVGRVKRLVGRSMLQKLIMIPGLNKIDSFMADHINNAMLLSDSTRPYT